MLMKMVPINRLSRLRVVVSTLALAALLCTAPALASGSGHPASNWDVPSAFVTGLKALKQHQVAAVKQSADQLGGGPLATYLEYRLRYESLANAKQADPAMLRSAASFLDAHPGFIFSHRLEARYLRGLAAQKQWPDFLAQLKRSPSYRDSTVFGCLSLQGHIHNGTMNAHQVRLARAIWSRGWSQPDACDPVFSWLSKHHHLDAALFHKRIRAAVVRGHTGLANYLARRGPKGSRHYMDRWLVARTQPEKVLREALQHHRHGLRGVDERRRLIHAMIWLSRSKPEVAHELLAKVPKSWRWSASERADLARRIALKAGYLHLPQAHDWLMALPKSVRNEEVLTWAVRSALRNLNWVGVQKAIARMPETLAKEPEWRYWQARADEAMGQSLAAQRQYRALTAEPGYYGLLAADRLGIDYAWPKSVVWASAQGHQSRAATLHKLPALRLAFILHAAGQFSDARSVFSHELKQLPGKDLPALARMAERAHWYDRVAVVVAHMNRSARQQWFAARYPMPWRHLVDRASDHQDISPDWLYAVVRRESLFMADVGSHAGAQGLMQLMPRTARWINRRSGLGLRSLDLHDPGVSIKLGAAYLRYLADRFPQQRPVAIAAYNAGPGRVKQWLPRQPLPADVWVDTIVYDETRAYTRAVLAGSVIYAWRRGGEDSGKALRLSQLMPTIGGTESAIAEGDQTAGSLAAASR